MLSLQQTTTLDAMGIQVWRERAARPTVPEHAVVFYGQDQQLTGYALHDEIPAAKHHAAYRLLDNILCSQGWRRGDKPENSSIDSQLPVLNFTTAGSLPSLSDLLDQPLLKRDVMAQLQEYNHE